MSHRRRVFAALAVGFSLTTSGCLQYTMRVQDIEKVRPRPGTADPLSLTGFGRHPRDGRLLYSCEDGGKYDGVVVKREFLSNSDLGRAIGRYFAKLLSMLILGIGYIMVAFDSEKRGLHDMICDTRVVRQSN
jgi:hypothetical protein